MSENKKKEACLHKITSVIDTYPIKLTTEQMAGLYPLMSAKRTLTWKDVLQNERITFRTCVEQKIDVSKLHKMQPDLEEWIKYDKVCLKDCKDMEQWRPNPFRHFNCHIGDLVMERERLPPRILMNGGVKFDILWERYGLRPEHMALLKYSPEDWVHLGFDEKYFEYFSDKQWSEIFQNLKKSEVLDAIKYLKSKL